jgi:hypothetical protein
LTATHTTFLLFTGDTWTLEAALHDMSNAALDLTDAVVQWNLRNAAQAVVASLSVGNGIVVTDAAGGLCTVTVPPIKTAALAVGDYADEIRVVMKNGIVTTQAVGVITVARAGAPTAPDLAGDLEKLKAQRRSGIAETQMENFRVTYRPDAEIARAIAATQNEIAGASQPRNVIVKSKGWSR